MPVELVFHESQYPEAVNAGLVDALRAGRVPGRFLYDSPGQAARWLAYHRAWSPSRTSDEVTKMYDAGFAAAWALHPEGSLTYVGIGCGGGAKDARFVTWGPTGRAVRYVAADTSPALVMTAAAAVAAAGREVELRRLVVDLQARPSRDAFVASRREPVVWSCLGMIPNLDSSWLLPYLRGLLSSQDSLLVSVNLSPAPHDEARATIRPQYDNPEARAWYRGALDELGLSADDATLEMSDRALRPDGALWRIECEAVLDRPCALHVFAKTVELPAGARLRVFHSDRYVPEAMPAIFEQHGLEVARAWVSSNREEGVYLLTPEPVAGDVDLDALP